MAAAVGPPIFREMSNNGRHDVERLVAAFAALSNPQRLRMFIRLASTRCSGRDEPAEPGRFCCATEVGAGLDIAGSTVSHHLKELRQAGLVHVERRGRRIDCWASQEMLQRMAAFFAEWAPASRRRKGNERRATPGRAR
jgi:ArsR family transcriptional regulator